MNRYETYRLQESGNININILIEEVKSGRL